MPRQALFLLIAVAVFGIGVPFSKGYVFLDPIFILGYSCIGVFFVSPAATESLAVVEGRESTLRRMAAILLFGWGVSALMLVSGIVTVNVANWHGTALLPGTRLLLSSQLLSIAACFAAIAASAVLAARFGSKAALSTMRLGFLVLLLVLVFGYPRLPDDWRAGVDDNLTTVGLTRFACRASAVLAAAGLALASWRIRRTP